MPQGVDVLYSLINGIASRMVGLRTATVSASTSNTCTITLGGGSVSGVPFLASYTPTTGDTVQVLQAQGQLLILGKVA